MLIFGALGIAVTAIAVWSTIHGQNGFAEVVKMIQGKPSFIVINSPSSGEQPESEPSVSPGSNDAPNPGSNDRGREGSNDRTASDEIRRTV